MASAKYKRSPALIKAFRSDLAPTMMSALMLKHERELDLLENIRRTAVDERRKSVDERRKAVDEREKQRTAIAIEHEKQRLALRQKDIFVAATQRNLAYARGELSEQTLQAEYAALEETLLARPPVVRPEPTPSVPSTLESTQQNLPHVPAPTTNLSVPGPVFSSNSACFEKRAPYSDPQVFSAAPRSSGRKLVLLSSSARHQDPRTPMQEHDSGASSTTRTTFLVAPDGYQSHEDESEDEDAWTDDDEGKIDFDPTKHKLTAADVHDFLDKLGVHIINAHAEEMSNATRKFAVKVMKEIIADLGASLK